jgi:hypothetical protein
MRCGRCDGQQHDGSGIEKDAGQGGELEEGAELSLSRGDERDDLKPVPPATVRSDHRF